MTKLCHCFGKMSLLLYWAIVVLVGLDTSSAREVYVDNSKEVESQDSLTAPRGQNLMAALRCPVCEGQALNDSEAPLAYDLRRFIRQSLAKGDSDRTIISNLKSRYGDSIMVDIPYQESSWLRAFWLVPFIFVLAGFGCMVFFFRKSQ